MPSYELEHRIQHAATGSVALAEATTHLGGAVLAAKKGKADAKRSKATKAAAMGELGGLAGLGAIMLAEGEAEKSGVCAKQDVINGKLDELLAKLAAQAILANETDAKLYTEMENARTTWLQSGADYDISKNKVQVSLSGSEYARRSFEKWEAAVKLAGDNLQVLESRQAGERGELNDEVKLIKELIQMIDNLGHKEAAVNGKVLLSKVQEIMNSKMQKLMNTKMQKLLKIESKQANDIMFTSTIAQLPKDWHERSQKLQGAAAMAERNVAADLQSISQHKSVTLSAVKSSLATLSRLAINNGVPNGKVSKYEESEEVKQILLAMLQAAQSRLDELTRIMGDAGEDVERARDKMRESRKLMVNLRDVAEDAHKVEKNNTVLRDQLHGDYIIAKETFEINHKLFLRIIDPYQKQIYIIVQIKNKIQAHCAEK